MDLHGFPVDFRGHNTVYLAQQGKTTLCPPNSPLGCIRTGCPDTPSCLFYNQVVFHPYYAMNAAGNLSGLFGHLVRVNKTA